MRSNVKHSSVLIIVIFRLAYTVACMGRPSFNAYTELVINQLGA